SILTKSNGFFVGFISTALALALALFVFTGDSSTVQAVPTLPHVFSGNVTVNGGAPGSGTSIQARIDNVNYAQSVQNGVLTRNTTTEVDGKFGQIRPFRVCGDNPETSTIEGGKAGDVIKFYVNSVLAVAQHPTTGAVLDPIAFVGGDLTHVSLVVIGGAQVGETGNSVACTVGDEFTPPEAPTPTFTPVPPFIPPVVVPPADDDDDTTAPAATATFTPTPTPISASVLETLTTEQQVDLISQLTDEQAAQTIAGLVEADADAGAGLVADLLADNADDAAEIINNLAADDVASILASDSLTADSAAELFQSDNVSTDLLGAALQSDTLGTEKAAEILQSDSVDAAKAAEVLASDQFTVEKAAELLSQGTLDSDKAAAMLGSGNLSADKAADILQEDTLEADRAASFLSSDQMATGKAAEILNSESIDANKGADILQSDSIDADKGAAMLSSDNLDAEKGAQLLDSFKLEVTASVSAEEAAENLKKAADIFDSGELNATKAAQIVDQPDLTAENSANILGEVEKTKAGAILEGVSNTKVEGVVDNMPEEKLVERLPEMSAEKLHTLTPEVLFDNLPSVPTEAITREFTPEVDPGCPTPEVTQVGEGLAVYEVCDTGVLAWATLVGSPAPIDSILGKFTQVRSGISVGVEDIDNLPDAAPAFSEDRVLNSFFNINVDGAEQGDLSAVHTTMFVEKSWIEANNIHKWSIAFNRFDEELGSWVPVTAKRVREDEERIYYTGVLPGFSTFAITGGTAPVVPQFTVTEPSDRPFINLNGSEATVSAEITNDGSDLLVYVANLWINDVIDRTQSIRVEPGETKAFTFPAVAHDPGDYDIRVERVTGSYKVVAPVRVLAPSDRPIAIVDGTTVSIAAAIQNIGNNTIGFEVVLDIEGEFEQSGTVEVPPGETAEFIFQDIIREQAGTYKFVVGGLTLIPLTGEFTIQIPDTPTPTPSPVPPTATPVPPTATPVPPTATPVPPTATPVPPTATPVPVPTATPVPPTATPVPVPTATPAPPPEPTATPVPPVEEEGGISIVLIIIIIIVVILIIVGAVYFYLYQQDELPPWLPPWMPGAPGSDRPTGLGPPIDPFVAPDDTSGDGDEGQRPPI
ncbi:MAG: PGF-pre-PGF domain-containing protein, partial [SAR202 cluster bacterium]|nr:PGF-pre-PGF domain-containing protein [SAR202 cluster bacterium]